LNYTRKKEKSNIPTPLFELRGASKYIILKAIQDMNKKFK